MGRDGRTWSEVAANRRSRRRQRAQIVLHQAPAAMGLLFCGLIVLFSFWCFTLPNGENRGQQNSIDNRVILGFLLLVGGMATLLVVIDSLRSVVNARFQNVDQDGAPRCMGCGYDLRASTDRCPECGMPSFQPSDPMSDAVTPPGPRLWEKELTEFTSVAPELEN
jgi:hypothetical protein